MLWQSPKKNYNNRKLLTFIINKMKTPFFTWSSYSQIMKEEYRYLDSYNWVDMKYILRIMNKDFIEKFANVDARELGTYVQGNKDALESMPPVAIGDNFKSFEEVLISIKLLMPSLWNCNYFVWDIGEGKHHGIDIILPQWTPIESFTKWEVIKAEEKGAYWNYVVIKSRIKWDDLFFCYEHLDSLDVVVWETINSWEQIGTCGTTGNSTQYHLHFQVDTEEALFHPYWSSTITNLKKYTLNPIDVLKDIWGLEKTEEDKEDSDLISELINKFNEIWWNNSENTNNNNETTNNEDIFSDMVQDQIYKNAITKLYKEWIIKWDNGKAYPDAVLIRYSFALLLYRIIKEYDLIDNIKNTQKEEYTDVDYSDKEFSKAVRSLSANGIMKGEEDLFFPGKQLFGEQLLVVFGRLFWNIKDGDWEDRYKPHMNKFIDEKIIDNDWGYIWKPIPRKEVFRIVYELIKDKF